MVDTTMLSSYPCPVCETEERDRLYNVKSFDIVKCQTCGMVYVNPRISNDKIFDIYKYEYFHRNTESGYDNYELTGDLRLKTFRKWYKDLTPYLPKEPMHALDIGCAAGYFLEVLKENGMKHEGIELDTEMTTRLRKQGYVVHDTPLELFNPDHKFDLITLFDVLEHLPGINDDFEKLKSMLTDNGIIVLVTPDYGSLQRKLFGKRWFQYKPHEHIYYFSPVTFRKIVEKHNFDIVTITHSGQYADFNFLHNRLARYGFPLFDKLFCTIIKTFGLEKKSWYADAGSMFAILKKRS